MAYKQQTFISHSYGGSEVQNRGTGRFWVLPDGSSLHGSKVVLLSVSSHSEGDLGPLWSLFSKALMPFVRVPTSWSESTSQRLHLLIYRLGFHPMNLRGTETFRPWWYFFIIRDSVTDSVSYFVPSAWTILFIPLTWLVMIPVSLLPVSGCFLKVKDKIFLKICISSHFLNIFHLQISQIFKIQYIQILTLSTYHAFKYKFFFFFLFYWWP